MKNTGEKNDEKVVKKYRQILVLDSIPCISLLFVISIQTFRQRIRLNIP